MAFENLSPVSDSVIAQIDLLNEQCLGHAIKVHSRENGMPELKGVNIAILGVRESRGSVHHIENSIDFSAIRRAFYSLYPGNWHTVISDLGDLQPGESSSDTYYALKEIVTELVKKNVVPVILGGSQDLTYAIYRAYDGLDQMVNLVNIDGHFDLGNSSLPITNKSFVGKIIVDQPYNLFNYSNIGYQTYYNSQEEIDLMEKLYFDSFRLGSLTSELTAVEPVMRDADVVSLDLTALIAQLIWYFIEGVNYRMNERLENRETDFLHYSVPVDDELLSFYKSTFSERWWIEIPFIKGVNNKLKRNTLLPCTEEDYINACNQEIPERWYKAKRKNEI